MKTSEKRIAKEHLLNNLALTILKDQGLKGAMESYVKQKNSQLSTHMDKQAYKDLITCKQVIDLFAEKLLACENPEMVVKTLAFVGALNSGGVYEAEIDDEQ